MTVEYLKIKNKKYKLWSCPFCKRDMTAGPEQDTLELLEPAEEHLLKHSNDAGANIVANSIYHLYNGWRETDNSVDEFMKRMVIARLEL